MSDAQNALIEVRNLKTYFPSKNKKTVRAVDGVDLQVFPKETLGLVGESGCGKSTLGRTIVGLTYPSHGSIHFKNREIDWKKERRNLELKRQMQFVFQDPSASLNPRKRVEQILSLPFEVHTALSGKALRKRLVELMEVVGLSEFYLDRYPHELSGGQKQRIGIARAISLNPEVVICDESVSALDVSIQAQVLNLLRQLQDEFDLTYLFISHDLSVVYYLSNRIAVMYLGHIVELAGSDELCQNMAHPYTQALFSALPDIEEERERIVLTGDIPSPVDPPSGCCFHTRCPMVHAKCREIEPQLVEIGNDHTVACHLYGT